MVLLGLKFVFARVRRTRKQTSAMEVIVIVDPVSTGARMAEVASSRGFRVVSLWSKECTPQIRGALAGIRDGYEAVEEQASIAATVEAIQDQLRRTSPSSATVLSACIPGNETGVKLADLISLHLGLLPHGSGNATFAGGDRRNKHVQQKALEKSGLRAVREVCGSKWQDVKDFLGDLGLPMVVKPVQSGGTDGVKLCQSLEEAEEHFSYIPERHEKESGLPRHCDFVSGISCWSGVCCRPRLKKRSAQDCDDLGLREESFEWQYFRLFGHATPRDEGVSAGDDLIYSCSARCIAGSQWRNSCRGQDDS